MSIRVFISHSTIPKEGTAIENRAKPAHAILLQELRLYLEMQTHPKFDISLDEKIAGSKNWLKTTHTYIEKCQAAIILVNKQALGHSDWITTEVIILGHRAICNKNFRLIIVPFDNVSVEEIKNNELWKPIALSTTQFVPRNGLNENNIKEKTSFFRDVFSILNGIEDYDEPIPSEWLFHLLCDLLPDDDDVLQQIAAKLDIIYDEYKKLYIKRKISNYLYLNGPLALLELKNCTKLVKKDWNGALIRDVLCTYWVHASASIRMFSCCHPKKDCHIFAINGKQAGYTPRTYIRKICGDNEPWPVIEVFVDHAARYQQDFQQSVTGQICKLLTEYKGFKSSVDVILKGKDLAHLSDNEKLIQALNIVLEKTREIPVFVTFEQVGGFILDHIINEIHDKFRHLNIIVCTGSKPEENLDLPGYIHMLTPQLDLDKEQKELKAFFTVNRTLNL